MYYTKLKTRNKVFAHYMNLLCVFLVWIKFIDSMSLCGFLVALLGLPMCVLFSFGPMPLWIVWRLCLEPVCLILMNFQFLT